MSGTRSPRPEPDPRHLVLMEEGRSARKKRQQRAARRKRFLAVSLVLLASVALGVWMATHLSRTPKATAQTEVDPPAPRVTMTAVKPEQPDPTPYFAAYRDFGLHVPVPIGSLIDVAFHQASYSYARHMSTELPTYPTDSASNKRGTGRTPAVSAANERGWLGGHVLRLWRDRPGNPDSAADVGAPPGTPVLAPVTGVVLLVKPYQLYGKYDDVQVHIRPVGHDDLDVVLIHVADPTVAAGQEVTGGVTRIGAVRQLSNRMHLQLGDFTTGTGDHVHMQVNQVKPGTTETVTGS